MYEFAIKAACTEAGAYCERIDEQIFDESILERIYNQITKADLIVADMSERNPNVYYEVGFAHGIGKKVILVTAMKADIPFGFLHLPHIICDGSMSKLKSELLKRAAWFTEHPSNEQCLAVTWKRIA